MFIKIEDEVIINKMDIYYCFISIINSLSLKKVPLSKKVIFYFTPLKYILTKI